MADPWSKLEQTSQKVGWKTVIEKTFMMPDGEPDGYTTIGLQDGHNVAMIAITDDGQVVVARQFRPGPEQVCDELPGGSVDVGEDPLAAGRRELREETGYESDAEAISLGIAFRDAYMNETNHYYLLTDCRQTGAPTPDHREFVEPALISIDQLIHNAKHAKMCDGVGVLMAYDHLMQLQAEGGNG